MRRKKKRELEIPDENWLVSYSDMMTLLLYLFVILYALAVLNKGDVSQSLHSFSNSLVNNSSIIRIFKGTDTGDIPLSEGSIISTYDLVKKYVEDNNMSDLVSVSKGDNGVTLQLRVEILFSSGSAEIKPDSKEILDKISLILKKIHYNDIIIKGFTDNTPINSGNYESNWELSSDRAVKILRYFTEINGLDATKFRAEGCGENNPIASNKTANGRQRNRRVEIFIVNNNITKNN